MSDSASAGRRSLPAVEKVLQALGPTALPRSLVVACVRRELAGLRAAASAPLEFDTVLARVRQALARAERRRLQPVINATGILLHTNLGRAPLSDAALRAVEAAGRGYVNLEFDLGVGERGGRAPYAETALAQLCGAEGALVVNNCAAALVLALRHFTRQRREVVVSRGELVQIGGGFRVPEILEASGAHLREIGTTNQTSLDDYARAIDGEVGLVLRVHRSNFYMEGFVAAPPTGELAALTRERGVPFLEDLGSGALLATEAIAGLPHEPTPAEVLGQGADLVTFSGDKLLGGPQAGILAGRGACVAALRRDPFFRALRCDKLVLAALEATLESHLRGRAKEELPLYQLAAQPLSVLRGRAAVLRETVAAVIACELADVQSAVGGGCLPRAQLASVALSLRAPDGPEALCRRLAEAEIPVIGRVEAGAVLLDLRTVLPSQDGPLGETVLAAAAP